MLRKIGKYGVGFRSCYHVGMFFLTLYLVTHPPLLTLLHILIFTLFTLYIFLKPCPCSQLPPPCSWTCTSHNPLDSTHILSLDLPLLLPHFLSNFTLSSSPSAHILPLLLLSQGTPLCANSHSRFFAYTFPWWLVTPWVR